MFPTVACLMQSLMSTKELQTEDARSTDLSVTFGGLKLWGVTDYEVSHPVVFVTLLLLYSF
jgi:hypothetical protein